MRRFVLALTFACALSSTALAGNIPSTDVAGNIPSTDVTALEPPPSPLVTIVLTIISAVV